MKIFCLLQSVLLKIILDYINEPKIDHYYASGLVVAVFVSNVLRGSLFNLQFIICMHACKSKITHKRNSVVK